jgi:hypothetical protein
MLDGHRHSAALLGKNMINFENDFKNYLQFILSSQELKNHYNIIRTKPSDNELSQKSAYDLINISLLYFSRFPRGKHDVVISQEMKNNELYNRFKKQIDNVVKSIETDNCISLYLPKNIGNVIYSDKLLADWGISHYHILPERDRKDNSDDKYIIYGIFDNETVLLIDIQDHNHFLEKNLLEIVDKYNPRYLVKLNGINGEKFDRTILKNLRDKKVGYVLDINESAFPTEMHQIQNMTFCSKILCCINSLQKEFLLNIQKFSEELTQKYSIRKEFDFHLAFDNIKHDVYVLENSSKTGCSWESNNLTLLKKMCLFKQLI